VVLARPRPVVEAPARPTRSPMPDLVLSEPDLDLFEPEPNLDLVLLSPTSSCPSPTSSCSSPTSSCSCPALSEPGDVSSPKPNLGSACSVRRFALWLATHGIRHRTRNWRRRSRRATGRVGPNRGGSIHASAWMVKPRVVGLGAHPNVAFSCWRDGLPSEERACKPACQSAATRCSVALTRTSDPRRFVDESELH